MCGIVGAVSRRNIVPILVKGLKCLEYRGYDSAGIAVSNPGVSQKIQRHRVAGKVQLLENRLLHSPLSSHIGIAHTRWATHGVPSETNAHPHIVESIALVHNGIIENYQTLWNSLKSSGYTLHSETDSEVLACYIDKMRRESDHLRSAIQKILGHLKGAYAFCVFDSEHPNTLIGARNANGPPLILGIGKDEFFFASDILALQDVSEQFIYLEGGDIAEISSESFAIYTADGHQTNREIHTQKLHGKPLGKMGYSHFMLKEIHEQPTAIVHTLQAYLDEHTLLERRLGTQADKIFSKTQRIQIVACGTSYYAGLVGRLWLESIAKMPCQVEIASEFRYREPVITEDTLVIFISQSGETADTLAALRETKKQSCTGTLAICNVPHSSLVRESDIVFLTQAGPEIGVCSTKAFTTQLTALALIMMMLGKRKYLTSPQEIKLIEDLITLPEIIQGMLLRASLIADQAEYFAQKNNMLFLGRGFQLPIALEGALKLKEISYIHAEAYPAGELKHGPLALVDANMPLICLAPNDGRIDKLKSNIQEIRARGGELLVLAPPSSGITEERYIRVLEMPEVEEWLTPFIYTIPLQLFAYSIAVLRKTNIDQPRNLAKSVTVE